MREIKFRAWDDSAKRMMTNPEELHSNTFNETDNGFHCGYIGDDGDWVACHLMQFTGLRDKNGVEICEGDILRFGRFALNDMVKFGVHPWNNLPDGVKGDDISTEICRIVFKDALQETAHLSYKIKDNPGVVGVEVIGNIHENPELLASI